MSQWEGRLLTFLTFLSGNHSDFLYCTFNLRSSIYFYCRGTSDHWTLCGDKQAKHILKVRKIEMPAPVFALPLKYSTTVWVCALSLVHVCWQMAGPVNCTYQYLGHQHAFGLLFFYNPLFSSWSYCYSDSLSLELFRQERWGWSFSLTRPYKKKKKNNWPRQAEKRKR